MLSLAIFVGLVVLVMASVIVLGARAGERNIMEREPEEMPLCSSCKRRHIPGLPCFDDGEGASTDHPGGPWP